MGYKDMNAADAVKLFAKQNIKVQEATAVNVAIKDADGNDTGKVRPAYETKMAALDEDHVISAKKYDDGRVTITTIDGRRFEAASNKGAAAAA